MPILPVNPPLAVDFAPGSRNPRPLAAPGNNYDASLHEDTSALYRARKQVTTITLGGTTATDDVSTLEIIPIRTAQGSAWADELGKITLTFTTGVTETLAAVAAGIAAAASAAQTVSTLADLANYQRVNDLVLVTSSGAGIILTSRDAGTRFSYVFTTDGSITESSVTIGDSDVGLNIGIVGVQDGSDSRGRPYIEAPATGSVSADILGVVMDGSNAAPSNTGDLFKTYPRGADAVLRKFGTATVYGEKGCTAGQPVYVRKVADAGEVAGAVSDTSSGDHIAYTGAVFVETTSQAGPQAIRMPHP